MYVCIFDVCIIKVYTQALGILLIFYIQCILRRKAIYTFEEKNFIFVVFLASYRK